MSGEPAPFVVVEGTTWVGKSTVTRSLARSLRATQFHMPPAFLRFRRSVSLDDAVGPAARIAYYVAAALQLTEMAQASLEQGPVVLDRYLASPVGVVVADGGIHSEEVDRLVSGCLPYLLRPTLTLLLVAPRAVAMKRVAAHAGPDGRLKPVHLRALGSDAHFAAWERAIRRVLGMIGGPVVEVQTGDMDIAEMRRTCLEAVRERVGSPARG